MNGKSDRLLNYADGLVQAWPCSFADDLGGKQGIKNLDGDLRGHVWTFVSNMSLDLLSGWHHAWRCGSAGELEGWRAGVYLSWSSRQPDNWPAGIFEIATSSKIFCCLCISTAAVKDGKRL